MLLRPLTALALAAATTSAAPFEALVAPSGRLAVTRGRETVANVTPGLYESGWRGAQVGLPASLDAITPELRAGRIKCPGGAIVGCALVPTPSDAELKLSYSLTPKTAVGLNSLHVALDFPVSTLIGGNYVADGRQAAFPAELGTNIHLHSAQTRELILNLADGSDLRVLLDKATPVLIQDNRKWGQSFVVRIGPQFDGSAEWPAGKPLDIAFTLSSSSGIKTVFDDPVTMAAGPEWVPLDLNLDIEPGSALDFSTFGQIDAPAGKHGHIITTDNGQLAFADAPAEAVRFYGVNFCFTAHYISHEQSDKLAERLLRLGYNTVRFHHFESRLVTRANGRSTELNPETLDQLDYLFAAFKKRGIYITADLFISRPVYAGEIWQGMKGNVDMSDFKMLVPVNETAFRNWETFSRNLMTHRNPYTGMTWAEDPALGWLSMINEGNFGNKIGGIKGRVAEDWQRAWNAWLKAHYKDAAAIATAWGEDVMGEPSANTVPLPKNATDDNRRSRDFSEFLADVEAKMFARMKRFLTEELGTKALLTNMNGWTNPLQAHLARQEYDYVDDHFYVDHPQFLEQRWRLPSRCPNTSPVAAGAPGGRGCAFTRLLDKPFTISEYNYSGPGRFRGVGGIITGCMGALQDWSVIWRFAYSHSNKNLFEPGPSGYFDLVADPLNQAAERASLCLYLRGDMKPASHTIAIAASRDDLVGKDGASGRVSPPWNALALVTKVGMSVTTESSKAPGDLVMRVGSPRDGELPLDPYAQDTGRKLVREMRKRGWLKDTNRTDLARKIHQSETEELTVDAPTDTLILNTPRTAGGYTPAGNTVEAGAVAVIVHETDATIWVSAVDDAPIASSKRLLITHLTDLQNTGAEFAERARKTLLARGELPHLVRRGTATVEVHCATPPRGVHAWALATSGRHIGSVPATVQGKTIKIPLDTLGNAGAQMLYEVVVQY